MRLLRPIRRVRPARSAALAFVLLTGTPARAAPLDLAPLQGAWALDGLRCEDTFVRQGTAIHFVRRGAIKCAGILIKSGRVEDSRHRCTILKGRAEESGQAVRLSCFSGLMVSKFALSVRFADQDTLI